MQANSGTKNSPDSQSGNPPPGGDNKPNKLARLKIPIIILIVIIIAAVVAYIFASRRNKEERPGFLRVSGRIEGYETNVGAKIAGRVEMIANREGEEVERGQLLVRLSDEDIQAQLRGARANYDAALQQVTEAEEQLNVAREQVKQAGLNVRQAREDAQGRIEQAAANVATQQAQYKQAVSQEVQARADLELARIRIKRYDELVVKGAVTQDEDDQAHSTYDGAVATVDARHEAVVAAQKQISAARAALIQARSNALNPPIRVSQEAANVRTVAQSEAALRRAKEQVKNAKATIDQIEANIAYLNIRSPIHGIVTARTVEPGAVVAAGQTVISLIDLDTVFLRAYVPDSEISKVRIKQKVDVFYDAAPKTAVPGRVIQIDPQASFTPENIYFREDRIKQVFGIKVQIDNPQNYAKPGMPADADIDIRQDSGGTTEEGKEKYSQEHKEERTVEKRPYADTAASANQEQGTGNDLRKVFGAQPEQVQQLEGAPTGANNN